MRILRLHLVAFGPFTNVQIDLARGEEGLHIVYGPNEAGKSSSLRAITDFFFGIPSRTPDDFLHRYSALRIGALLRGNDQTEIELIRRKANQGSLRLGDDATPVDAEETLRRLVGEVDRTVFQSLFGLNHDRLRRGGEEIAQGSGKLGEILFSSGAGVAALRLARNVLQEESDKLLKATGRSGSIVTGVKELKELRSEVKAAQIPENQWRAHDERLQSALVEKESLDDRLSLKNGERNRLVRVRDAQPVVAHWRQALEEWEPIRNVPLLPTDFDAACHRALIELSKADQQRRDAEASILQIDAQLAEWHVPEKLLHASASIQTLRERWGAFQKAMTDLPGLESSRELAESDVRETLRKLGRPPDLSDIEALRLPTAATVRIQNLGNRRLGLTERLQSARRECDRFGCAISRDETKLQGMTDHVDSSRLRNLVQQIQPQGNLEAQFETTSNELDSLRQQADAALRRLAPWSGTLAEAENLPLPSLALVDRYDDQLRNAYGQRTSLQERLSDEQRAQQEIDERLARLELEQSIPSRDDLESMRRQRDRGWSLVLRAWQSGESDPSEVSAYVQACAPSQNLAEAYRQSVLHADQIVDSMRSNADRVATKAQLTADRVRHATRETTLAAEMARAEAEIDALQDAWQAIGNSLGIPSLTPLEMRDWLHRREQIVHLATQSRAAQLEADQLKIRIATLRKELCAAIQSFASEAEAADLSLRQLLQIASDHSEAMERAAHERRRLVADLATRRTELEAAESRLEEAEAALEQWQADWEAEMGRLGLKRDADPSEANSVLTDVTELFQKQQEARHYAQRIAHIGRDAAEFRAAVRQLAEDVAPDLSDQPVEKVVDLIAQRSDNARSLAEKRDAWNEQRDALDEKRRSAASTVAEMAAALDAMRRQAQCANNDQLSAAARQSRRRQELETTVRQLESQILSQGGGLPRDAFVDEVAREAADVDALQARIDQIACEIDELNKQRDEVLRTIEREEAELRRIDGSAAAAEKASLCESVAARLEDEVRQLAICRIAAAVLHSAMEQHREKNQGPVLAHASRTFSQITLGAFAGLRADFDERGEPLLTGVRAGSGEAVSVAAMSDGTCDQLFLALRLAAIETWLDRNEAIPFIVDDVLLTFDDQRAVAALHALAQLARRTQVIFFTHHRRLVELAQMHLSDKELFVASLGNPTP